MTSVSRWGGMARPCSGRVLNLLVTSIGGSPIYQQDMRASTGTPGFLVKVSYNTREECVGGNSQGVFFRVHSLAFAPRGCALWNWLHFSNLQKVSGQHLPLHLFALCTTRKTRIRGAWHMVLGRVCRLVALVLELWMSAKN